ncbi:MAG: Ig-like domain-containing protein, partial [Rhodothermales bacterium]|nr:Ig-like domain-containing protein [Rhodothermales bacterium]
TTVFGLRSGTSSEPWEPGPDPANPLTQPRDRPLLAINPPEQLAVDASGPAVYTLSLTHAGESEEAREYVLRTIHASNPGGAVLRAQGAPLHAGLSFWIQPQQTQEVTLEVFRGPNRYEYEDLAVQLYQPGEYSIWVDGGVNGNGIIQLADTVQFTAKFKAPCSDIAVLRPKENWILNATTIADSLGIDLHEFVLQVSESDAVQSLGLEYRLSGSPDWIPAREIQASQLSPDATSWSTKWLPPRDGLYDVRAFTACEIGGRVNSDPVAGTVDTKAPLVFGAPDPGDEILALGDDIAITFDEAMACGSIDTEGVGKNTTLTYADGPNAGSEIPITPVCDGRTVILVPEAGYDWTQAENRLLQVDMLTNVVDGQSNPSVASDLAGNAINEPITWQFTVQRSAFTWSPTNLTVNILGDTELDAALVNGRAQEVSYTLADVPTWLSPSVGGGSLPPGGTETIEFVVDTSQLTPGTRDTLAAETPFGDALLYLNTVCSLDSWTVDPALFQYSMTLTGQLFVDGVVSDDENDRVAAFVGSELRGVANVSDVSVGSNRVNLTVYSNNPSGETVTLRAFDASVCDVSAGTDRTFTFVSGSGLGTPEQPVAINATDELEQQAISLAAGWTWFSLNREPGNTAVAEVLSSVLARSNDIVKSQTAFSVYDQGLGGWVGSLNEIEPGRTYLIKTTNANTLVLGGPPVDPGASPVSVV